MKWIKYQFVCNEESEILLTKKIGYSEANLAIAKKEAYNGQYTIEEDSKQFEIVPLEISKGGTGAKTASEALAKLGGLSKSGGVANGPITVTNGHMAADTFMQNPVGYGKPVEIGQYLDFHKAGSSTDFDMRITVGEDGSPLVTLPGQKGKALYGEHNSHFSNFASGKYTGNGLSGYSGRNQIPIGFLPKVMVITRLDNGYPTGETSVIPFVWEDDGSYASSEENLVVTPNKGTFATYTKFGYDAKEGVVYWYSETPNTFKYKANLTTGLVDLVHFDFPYPDDATKVSTQQAANQLNWANKVYCYYIFG